MDDQKKDVFVFDEMRRRVLIDLIEEMYLPDHQHNPVRLKALERAMDDDFESQFVGYNVRRPILAMSMEDYLALWDEIEKHVETRKNEAQV